MIDALNSKRMTVIVVLIVICTVIVIIEEWFTNSQLVISSPVAQRQELDKQLLEQRQHQKELLRLQQEQVEQQEMLLKQQTNDWRFLLRFLSMMGFFGGISGLATKYRQQQLRCKSLARFRKQDSRDSSCHALIDMRNHTS